MRINRTFVAFMTLLFSVLTVSACTSNISGHGSANLPSTVTSTTLTTPTQPVPQRTAPQPQVNRYQAVVDYYISEERRAPLRQAVDVIGRELVADMLGGKIPWLTSGWDEGVPAPENGYGFISSNVRGMNRADVMVKFVDGQVDQSAGVVKFWLDVDGVSYSLNSDYVVSSHGQPVANAEGAYSWSHFGLGGKEYNAIRLISNPPSADFWAPYDPKKDYEVVLYPHSLDPVSIEDVKAADQAFLDKLYSLQLF